VDAIRSKAEEVKGKRLHLTKGVHLVFDHARLPIRQALYFDVEDGG
jgi:glycerol-3-phosphate dehydrogenase